MNKKGWMIAATLVAASCSAARPVPAAHSPAAPSGIRTPIASAAPTATSARTRQPTAATGLRPPRFPPAPSSFAALRLPPGHHHLLYLTFDDGPSPYTRAVLAQLAKVQAHAVFCLIGNNAIRRAADVRAEIAAGDPPCDHSRDHSKMVASSNRRWVSAEVDDGLREILSVDGGVKVRFYRQPYGLWTRLVVNDMYAAKLDPLRWTDDPRDWSRPGAIAIAQRVLLRLRPGAIVLMHDGGGDRGETVAALGWLLPHLVAAGWRFGLPVPQRLSPREASRPQ